MPEDFLDHEQTISRTKNCQKEAQKQNKWIHFTFLKANYYQKFYPSMNYRLLKPIFYDDRNKNMAMHKAKSHRRLNASNPKEEQIYIDERNLWKASTKTQEKQYEAIKSSGILQKDRKLTFLHFNFRYSEEKNLCFPEAYHNHFIKPREKESMRIKKLKKDKENREAEELEDQVKNQSLKLEVDWLSEFHETKKEKEVNSRNQTLPRPGTMNVCELWGEKQLQQSLGFLPCKRDRPKLLKLYSKMEGKDGRKRGAKYLFNQCLTEKSIHKNQ